MSERTPRPVDDDVVARFWGKVDRGALEECWLWTACVSGRYGQFKVGENRRVAAHRFAYELLVGPIPDGLVLDHLCKVTVCVNPAHLEPVTQRENVLRGEGGPAENAKRTHCKYGHEFTPENTRMDVRGGRVCVVCRRRRLAEYKARRRARKRGPHRA